MFSKTPKRLFKHSSTNAVTDHIPPSEPLIELVSVDEDGIELRDPGKEETTHVEWEVAQTRYTPSSIRVPKSKTIKELLKPDNPSN